MQTRRSFLKLLGAVAAVPVLGAVPGGDIVLPAGSLLQTIETATTVEQAVARVPSAEGFWAPDERARHEWRYRAVLEQQIAVDRLERVIVPYRVSVDQYADRLHVPTRSSLGVVADVWGEGITYEAVTETTRTLAAGYIPPSGSLMVLGDALGGRYRNYHMAQAIARQVSQALERDIADSLMKRWGVAPPRL
jgi:hypothetical protein